jgi:methionyl-tRNA formyltransferase
MNGEEKTGITVMYMDEGMDTGDIMLQSEHIISPEETFGTLSSSLSEKGASLICEALKLLEEGKAPRIKQNDAAATYADKIDKSLRKIDFSESALRISRIIRAMDPSPAAYALLGGKMVQLFSPLPEEGVRGYLPGEIISGGKGGIVVQCGEGALLIREVKPEGKQRMAAGAFYNGLREKVKFE